MKWLNFCFLVVCLGCSSPPIRDWQAIEGTWTSQDNLKTIKFLDIQTGIQLVRPSPQSEFIYYRDFRWQWVGEKIKISYIQEVVLKNNILIRERELARQEWLTWKEKEEEFLLEGEVYKR